MSPTHFPLEAIIVRSLPLVTRGLLHHVLKSIQKNYVQSTQLHGILNKQQVGEGEVGGRGITETSKKDNFFQSHQNLSAIQVISLCTILPCPFQRRLFSFLQFGRAKNFFSSLSPQAEEKEDGEHFANHLQMYVGRTFTKAK